MEEFGLWSTMVLVILSVIGWGWGTKIDLERFKLCKIERLF